MLQRGMSRHGVTAIPGCTYHKIDDKDLHYSIDDEPRLLPVDNVVICAGQESEHELAQALRVVGVESDDRWGALCVCTGRDVCH